MSEFYNKLVNVSIKVGYDRNTIKFLGFYSNEIGNLFFKMNMQDAISFLIKYDIKNEDIYKQYIK